MDLFLASAAGQLRGDQERAAFVAHAQWLGRLLADGVLILAGPTLGAVNTGIGIFEASDEETARAIIAEDPVTRGGFARTELRPYQLRFCAAATESDKTPGHCLASQTRLTSSSGAGRGAATPSHAKSSRQRVANDHTA